jgi:putative SOS response-associated peptidase YedK
VCGRFVTKTAVADLAERLQIDDVRAPETGSNYNVTPRAEVAIVAANGAPRPNEFGSQADADLIAATERVQRVLDRVRWGLVPSWAKDLSIGDKMINARSETIREKPAFKRAFTKRRCIIPVDGFYEWKRVGTRKAKQPVFIHSTTPDALLTFAGVYEVWRDKTDPEAPWIRTCSIITTSANKTIEPIHNRMPVLLEPHQFDEWLDPSNHDVDSLAEMLVPSADDAIQYYPVRLLVNKAANNFAELLEPAPPEALLEME